MNEDEFMFVKLRSGRDTMLYGALTRRKRWFCGSENDCPYISYKTMLYFDTRRIALRLEESNGTEQSTNTTEGGSEKHWGAIHVDGSAGGTGGRNGGTASGSAWGGGTRSRGRGSSRACGSRRGNSRAGRSWSSIRDGDRGRCNAGDTNGGSAGQTLRSSSDEEVGRVDTVGDGRVCDTVGGSWVEGWGGWGNGLADSPELGGTTWSSVGTGVSLSEGRGRSVWLDVETWRWGSLTLARGERVVGLVEVRNGHDELTAHHVELVFTLQSSGNVVVLSSADSETELVVRDERHPFLVEDIAAGWDVGRDVSADRVTDVLGTVGVELSSRVTIGDVHLGTVPETVNLNVQRRSDEVGGGDGTIGDESCVVSWLSAVSDDDRLDVSDQAVWSWLWWTVKTKVIDAVQRQETGERGLVDLRTDGGESWLIWVGDTVGEGSGDLAFDGVGGEQ